MYNLGIDKVILPMYNTAITMLRRLNHMDTDERTVIDLIKNSKDPTAALEIAFILALNLLGSLGESPRTELSSLPA